MGNPPRTIKTAERVFDIIEVLHEQGECNLTTISNEIGLAESTTHQYMATLTMLDLIEVDKNQNYRLSLKFLDYGGQARLRLPFFKYVREEMLRLEERTGFDIVVGVEEGLDMIRLGHIWSEAHSWVGPHLGYRSEFHSSSIGKALLAHFDDDKLKQVIAKHGLQAQTENTITTKEELNRELERIRNQGHSKNNEESQKNLIAFAVPVFDGDELEGAICIAGPKADVENKGDHIIEELNGARNRIELRLSE